MVPAFCSESPEIASIAPGTDRAVWAERLLAVTITSLTEPPPESEAALGAPGAGAAAAAGAVALVAAMAVV